ncbi:DUF6417 family protein [Streptomyces mirabilis]
MFTAAVWQQRPARPRALFVLEALCERGQAAGHGWTLDTELLPPHQQQANALENQGLVELASPEDRAELSALEGRHVRWAARLTSYGHDTLAYGQSRPGPSLRSWRRARTGSHQQGAGPSWDEWRHARPSRRRPGAGQQNGGLLRAVRPQNQVSGA